MKNKKRPKEKYLSVSVNETEHQILNDIRQLEYGRVVIYIQNRVVISKEVIKTTKMPKD